MDRDLFTEWAMWLKCRPAASEEKPWIDSLLPKVSKVTTALLFCCSA
jgi:hypothetical protein